MELDTNPLEIIRPHEPSSTLLLRLRVQEATVDRRFCPPSVHPNRRSAATGPRMMVRIALPKLSRPIVLPTRRIPIALLARRSFAAGRSWRGSALPLPLPVLRRFGRWKPARAGDGVASKAGRGDEGGCDEADGFGNGREGEDGEGLGEVGEAVGCRAERGGRAWSSAGGGEDRGTVTAWVG